MSRIVLTYVLPLVLPTALYLAWAWLANRRTAGGPAVQLAGAPWFWLILSGVVLMAAGLVATALIGGADPGSRIIPPRYEDGRVVPARIE